MAVSNPVHGLFSSHSQEWYTPSIYIKAAREVMGGIDLDPASCEKANEVVRANTIYTKADNGLLHEWFGNVWLNPPYGTTNNKSNTGIWIKRLIEEYTQGNIQQAITLVNGYPNTRWFHQLFAFLVCFTEGNINFYNSTHRIDTAFSRPNKLNGSTHGSAFVYLGENEQSFIDVFSQFGTVVKKVSKDKVQPITLSLWKEI